MPNSYEIKLQLIREVKLAVARYVWDHYIILDANPRLYLDAGSSVEAIATVISQQLENDTTGVVVPTVFTHNLAAWTTLSKCTKPIDLYLVGGRYNPNLNAIIEASGFESQLNLWFPNIAIIAVSGIDENGLYCSNIQDEHPVKAQLAKKKVDRRIIVCDHSKIGCTDVRMFLSLADLKQSCGDVVVITDQYDHTGLEPAYRKDDYLATLAALDRTLGKSKVIQVEISPPRVDSARG